MTVLRNPNLFSPHRQVLAAHSMGRYIMDIDQLLVNYARGFVLHMELKAWNERQVDAKQMATIQMVADVWAGRQNITRVYHDHDTTDVHHLRWKGFYIFRAGDDEGLTNDHPWQLLIIGQTGTPPQQYSGDDGAVRALSDIARGAI